MQSASDARQVCETVESAYEFSLAYAAHGHGPQGGGPQEAQLRQHLQAALDALANLPSPGNDFAPVLAADARAARAAFALVLAQPAISSQLVENLNASVHVRALLTDLFLLAEVG